MKFDVVFELLEFVRQRLSGPSRDEFDDACFAAAQDDTLVLNSWQRKALLRLKEPEKGKKSGTGV